MEGLRGSVFKRVHTLGSLGNLGHKSVDMMLRSCLFVSLVFLEVCISLYDIVDKCGTKMLDYKIRIQHILGYPTFNVKLSRT